MATAVQQFVCSPGPLAQAKLSRSPRSVVQKVGLRTSVGHVSTKNVRRRLPVSCVLEQERLTLQADLQPEEELPISNISVEEVAVLESDQGIGPKYKILLSDVEAQKKRPFFLREWNTKDVQYGVYMLFVHGLCLFAPATFSWPAFGAFASLYLITGMLGITLSYHRHLSHRSFDLPKWLEYVFAYCGAQAVQGPPLEWVSAHRIHHRFCDTPLDPHTPHESFWHSHMGWLLDNKTTDERVGVRNNISDLENDPFYNWLEDTYAWHVVASAVALYLVGGFPFLVWGFAVRAVWVYHITWAVNSVSHVWGFQSWNTGDESRNNWLIGVLAFGEGWHNNHHAFEYSSRHGLEWWQVDATWYFVKALEAVGLASKLRYPRPQHMEKLSFPQPAN